MLLTTCFDVIECFLKKKQTKKTKKKVWNKSSASFFACFLKENICHIVFYELTKFHCQIAFTSWDIEHCVYCNCLPGCCFFLSGFSFTNIHDSQDSRGKGRLYLFILLYHFYPLHRHLDISRAITAESSHLHIASRRTRIENL